MDYIIISTESRSEKNFFLDLLKKMKKKATALSSEEMEDYAFLKALKQSEKSSEGSLLNVKSHLTKAALKE